MKTKSFKEILKETIQRNCTDDYDGMFLFFESSVIEAHNEYASQFQQEWIPVEVRLPEDCRMLFVTLDNGTVSKGQYWPDGWRFLGSEEDKVIAWMESHPQPYNPKQS